MMAANVEDELNSRADAFDIRVELRLEELQDTEPE